MQRLDRLGWAAGICFAAYGLRVGIRVNNPAVLSQVLPCLPVGWKPALSPAVDLLYSAIVGGDGPRPGIRRFHLLYAGPAKLARTMELDQVFEILESDLQLRMAELAPRRIFVHAGVVGWRGRALVIPGRSFSGKTTLVAALVRAGAAYYSDEYAVLDPLGRVHPYPKPLSIRQASGEPARKCTAEELGGVSAAEPLRIGLVVVTKYQPGATWHPRQLSRGQGLLALLAHSVPARRKPKKTFNTLLKALAGAQILKSERGEAQEMVNSLLKNQEQDPCYPMPVSMTC